MMKKIFTGMMVGVMAFVAMAVPTTVEAKETNMRIISESEAEAFTNEAYDKVLLGEAKQYSKFAHPQDGPYRKQITEYIVDLEKQTTMVAVGGKLADGSWVTISARVYSEVIIPNWNNPDVWMT